jgi:hypothetical protein
LANGAGQDRRKICAALTDQGITLISVLQQISVLGDTVVHRANLEKLRRDAQFGHDMNTVGIPNVGIKGPAH